MTPSDLNEAPYPPEIKARGWGFDIDVERIEASETWALAGPELRPWLLMTWITAWRSQPVGTMPAAPRVFAARIGMHWVPFQDAADILMRGWVQHADGLLYHPVITERVLAMSEKRLKDSVRVATWRARNAQPRYTLQTGDTDVTGTDATRDERVSTTPLPLPIPNGEREQDKPATRSTGKSLTFAKWSEVERAEGRSLIADWKPLAAYQASTGLPDALVQMAWIAFKDRYTNSTNYRAKKYTDWRDVFLNAIKGNWLNLWFMRDDIYELTTVGKQAERAQATEVTE